MTASAPNICAVVLAAGGSTRFGSPKQLALIDGEPLVRRAVRAALEAGAHPTFVVVGADSRDVASAVRELDGVVIVDNDDWRSGLASSLRAGLRAADPSGADAILITTVDQPLVGAHELSQLVAAFACGARVVAAEYDGAVGVPALIGVEHVSELSQFVGGDAGAGRWLRERADLVRVAMPAAALDVDTAAALAEIPRGR